MHSLYVVKETEVFNITEIVGGISWGDDIDTLGVQLDFIIAWSDGKYFPNVSVEPGDKVSFLGDKGEIFIGIVVTQNINGNSDRSYTAFDFGFYMNKSAVVMQFNKINASAAIGQLCSTVNIKVGGIAAMPTLITHIYASEVVSDIIKDILGQVKAETGIKLFWEIRGDSFFVFEPIKTAIKATYKPTYNLAEFDVVQAISNPIRTLSIEDMKNSITIISQSEDSVRVLGKSQDSDGINKYGLLQIIENVDDKDINNVQYIADTRLKELNKVVETNSIELLGNDEVRAGRILNVEESNTGMKGNYMIKSCKHSLSNGIHTMAVELEAVS